jgi:hypothetical protein
MSIKAQTVADAIESAARQRAEALDVRDRFDGVTLRAFLHLTAEVTGDREVTVTGPARVSSTVTTWDSLVRSACSVAIDHATDQDTDLHGYTSDGHIADPDSGRSVTFTW